MLVCTVGQSNVCRLAINLIVRNTVPTFVEETFNLTKKEDGIVAQLFVKLMCSRELLQE